MKPVLGVVVSLRLEAGYVLGWTGWHRQEDRIVKRVRLDSGLDLFCICSGAGAENAEAAVRVMVSRGVTALACIGVSGGLDPGLHTGDLFIADTIVRENVPCPVSIGEPISGRLSNILIQSGARVCGGTLVTLPEPVLTVKEKTALFKQYGAKAVDMESGFVIRAADEFRLPMLVLRVICDAADRGIPSIFFKYVSDTGSLRWRFLLRTLHSRPSLFGSLIPTGYDFYRSLVILKRAWRLMGTHGLLAEFSQRGV